MESYGAHCVYVTDSGGRADHGRRTRAGARLPRRLEPETQIGIHAHENLSLAVANSIVGGRRGRYRVDASLAGHGRRRRQRADRGVRRRRRPDGLASTAATCSRCRTPPTTSCGRCRTVRSASTARRSPSATPASTRSFLRHAEVAAETLRRRRRASCCSKSATPQLVGGQEDMIVDIALTLSE